MTNATHLAASYLLAQSSKFAGLELNNNDVLLIVTAGLILDIDYVIGYAMGKKGEAHHNFITHTPFGAFVIWALFSLTFGNQFSMPILALSLLSLFIHLTLDDVSHWFYKLKLQETSKYPQINWAYPITKFGKVDEIEKSPKDFIMKAKANTAVELILISLALFLFLS